MKLSARDQIGGKIVVVRKGQTTAHVRMNIGGGVVTTSSIIYELIDDLDIAVDEEAMAMVKAADVMVAK